MTIEMVMILVLAVLFLLMSGWSIEQINRLKDRTTTNALMLNDNRNDIHNITTPMPESVLEVQKMIDASVLEVQKMIGASIKRSNNELRSEMINEIHPGKFTITVNGRRIENMHRERDVPSFTHPDGTPDDCKWMHWWTNHKYEYNYSDALEYVNKYENLSVDDIKQLEGDSHA